MIRFIVIIHLLFSFFVHLSADIGSYYFRNIGLAEGLSHSTVNVIYQDRTGFIWFGTKDGLNKYDGINIRVFKKENSKLGNNIVTVIYEDTDGKLWVGTDVGVYVYNPLFETFEFFDCPINGTENIINRTITCIDADRNGNIWIASDYQGLFCYDKTQDKLCSVDGNIGNKKSNVTHFWFSKSQLWVSCYEDNLYNSDDYVNFKTFKDHNGTEPFNGFVINDCVEGVHNCLFIASSGGLFEVNMTTSVVKKLSDVYVRSLCFSSENELWAGTEQGIYIYDLKEQSFDFIDASDVDDKYALSDNAIYSIFKDNEDGIWVGSYFGGVNYYNKKFSYFKKYYPRDNLKYLGKRVREFCPSNDGTVWIGTEDKGLFNFNPHNGLLKPFNHPLLYHNIHGLCLDDNYLWVGTFSGGLNRIDLRNNTLKRYVRNEYSGSLNANNIFSLCKTSTGDLWIGTTSGLQKYNRNEDNFSQIRELKNVFIYDIIEDYKGRLWIATYSDGVYCYDLPHKEWKHYNSHSKEDASLPYDKIIGLFEDSKKRLWVMTQGYGFCLFNQEKDNFVTYSVKDGFPSNIIYDIVEDNSGLLWLSTNNGLVSFNPETGNKHVYSTANGLLENQFNYKSGYKDNNGILYFGSINGFVSFNPDDFIIDRASVPDTPRLVLSDFFLYNKRLDIKEEYSPLSESITFADDLQLKADQNSFSLNARVLSYQAPLSNIVSYRLDGFDKEWNYITENNSRINYSNLPYGKYVLHVKGANSDGVWTNEERVLDIKVFPPFYLSWQAYFIYIILCIASVYYSIYYFKRRSLRKHMQAVELLQYEKEREIYNAKIDFFTNVAHEIRTPLTLIKNPLENVLESGKIDDDVKEDLEIMNLNTNRLLDLVNQLLDFRKTETKGFQLDFIKCDVSEIIRSTYKRFTPTARDKKIDFNIQISDNLNISVDKEGFTKIISNLFTNAIKYGKTYINVRAYVIEKNNSFQLEIENDGNVIPVEMREEIFKPFTQCHNGISRHVQGTGIGLALARSLAELHGGTLVMGDDIDKNSFVLNIPIYKQGINPSLLNEEKKDSVSSEYSSNTEEVSGQFNYTLLVVDDNIDMRNFLQKELSKKYNVLIAKNGIEALDILKTNIVNLIVSDVMMPEMDGFELCNNIKTNLDYSHIPVILLTAKTNLQSKIEGLKNGADAYVDKPFSMEYLFVNIANLLKNREQLHLAFMHTPFLPTNSIAINKADEEFLKKLNDIVQVNLQNPDFSLLDIADQLCMSRSSLNRKIKGLLDVTPNDYIRIERLKKAAQLFKEGNGKINEVCYMVGFNTPSYFTKCFQKQFGVLPKDFLTGDK